MEIIGDKVFNFQGSMRALLEEKIMALPIDKRMIIIKILQNNYSSKVRSKSVESINIDYIVFLLKKENIDEEIIVLIRNLIEPLVKDEKRYQSEIASASTIQKFLSFLGSDCAKIHMLLKQNKIKLGLKTDSDFLKHNEIEQNYTKDPLSGAIYLVEVSKLYSWLKNGRAAIKGHYIFTDFDFLQQAFGSKLSAYEKSEIIIHIVIQNIKAGILDTDKYTGLTTDYPKEHLKYIKEALYTSDIDLYPVKFSENFYKIYFAKNIGLNALININSGVNDEKFAKIKKAHQIIKEHYLDKVNSYDENDIKELMKAFRLLGLSSSIIDAFESEFNKCLFLRKNAENPVKEKVSKYVEIGSAVSEVKPLIPKKVFNTFYFELCSYYDFDKMKPMRELYLDEIIYSLCLLNKLGFSQKDTLRFINDIKYSLSVSENLDIDSKIEERQGIKSVVCFLEDIKLEYGELFKAFNSKTFISLNEFNEYVNLLKSLMLPEGLFNHMIEYLYNKVNPITKYGYFNARIEPFKENEDIKDLLNELDDTFKRIFITSNEDYELCKEYIDFELGDVLDKLGYSHGYEYFIEEFGKHKK